jgi:hypothetical protein
VSLKHVWASSRAELGSEHASREISQQCRSTVQLQYAAAALQAADAVARQLAAEGSANRSSPAQLLAGFLAQTAAILAAWQRGKRFRCALQTAGRSSCRAAAAWGTVSRGQRRCRCCQAAGLWELRLPPLPGSTLLGPV